FSAKRNPRPQWLRPRLGEMIVAPSEYVEFWRCLRFAQQCEANLRFAAATDWLEERGMDGLVDSEVYTVIRGAADDYDPECSAFVFPFRLQGKLHCLILKPECDPCLCWRPFSESQ